MASSFGPAWRTLQGGPSVYKGAVTDEEAHLVLAWSVAFILHYYGGHSKNNDGAVEDVPENMALITCTYNDYYRSFSMTVQVKTLPAQITAKASC